jgi:tRNA wybutosine-synthesizing protein 4
MLTICLLRQPTISFSPLPDTFSDGQLLSSFGAQVVHLGASVIICGGMGADPLLHGQTITAIRPSVDGMEVTNFSTPSDDKRMPFMIGSSIIPHDDSLLVMGGGATCFSMGTFWETGIYKVHMSDHILDSIYRTSRPFASSKFTPDFIGSRKFSNVSAPTISDDVGSLHRREHEIQVTPVPRIQLESAEQFQKILRDGKPVIFKSYSIGLCQSKWSPEFLVSQIGANEKVRQDDFGNS